MTKRERIAARLLTFAAGCLLTSAALAQEGIETTNYGPPTAEEIREAGVADLPTIDRPPEPLPASVWAAISPLILGFIVAIADRFIKSKRSRDATKLIADIAVDGVHAAWEAYTAGKKAASADGKLTAEEASHAKRLALEAALASAGPKGRKLLFDALRDGVDPALSAAMEREYGHVREKTGLTPALGTAPVKS